MVVSWASLAQAIRPRVLYGSAGKLDKTAHAVQRTYTDGLNGQTTYHYHVQLRGLRPDTQYYYQVSDGAAGPSVAGASFMTAPFGRRAHVVHHRRPYQVVREILLPDSPEG